MDAFSSEFPTFQSYFKWPDSCICFLSDLQALLISISCIIRMFLVCCFWHVNMVGWQDLHQSDSLSSLRPCLKFSKVIHHPSMVLTFCYWFYLHSLVGSIELNVGYSTFKCWLDCMLRPHWEGGMRHHCVCKKLPIFLSTQDNSVRMFRLRKYDVRNDFLL